MPLFININEAMVWGLGESVGRDNTRMGEENGRATGIVKGRNEEVRWFSRN